MARHVAINFDKCKGCWLCIEHCPSNLLRISNKENEKGYKVIEMVDSQFCMGNDCLKCANVCPDNAIIKPTQAPDKISSFFYWLGNNIPKNVFDRKHVKK